MKTALGESVFDYENVSLEGYAVRTSSNLLYKWYSLLKIQHMEQDDRGHKKMTQCVVDSKKYD